MKNQTKRIISLILSCLMIFSGMTLTVFADTAHDVQVLKAPASGASYGKLYWNNTNYSHDGVNDILFSILPDSEYDRIEVTTDYGETVFSAEKGAESLAVGTDGSVSFHVNAGEISRVGDNTLTLTVDFADGSNWSQDYDVYIQPQSGSYANDFSGVTTSNVSASTLGLVDLKKDAANYTYTVENVDGEYAFKMDSGKTYGSVTHYFDISPNLKNINKNTDVYVEYDFYADSGMEAKALKTSVGSGYAESLNSNRVGTMYPNTDLDNTSWTPGCWYTFRYVIDISEKTMTLYLVKNGVVTDTVHVSDLLVTSKGTAEDFFNDDGTFDLYQARFSWYYDPNIAPVTDGEYCAIDNIRVYRVIPIESSLSYCEDGSNVEEGSFLNGKVSENADSVTATLGGDIAGKTISKTETLDPVITLYKGEELISSNPDIDGDSITFSNLSLKSGADYRIKIEDVNIASMPLQGYLEIPFATTNLEQDITESCTISVNNADALKIGKVMTVNATVYPGFKSAEIYFDDTVLDTLEENQENSYAVRYLIPDNVIAGSHKVKVIASYSALDKAVVKEQDIIVSEKDAPDYSSTVDFENYASLANTKIPHTDASRLNMRALGDMISYYITSDADRGYVLKGVNETAGEVTVANSFVEIYAFSDKSAKTSGKLSLEFDFYISHQQASNYMQVVPYDASSNNYSTSNIVAAGSVPGMGENEYLSAGWHKFNGEIDLDAMEYSYSVDDITIADKLKTNKGAQGISYYRIGISTHKISTTDNIAKNWALDNIKFAYSKTPIYASASYVKGADEFAANKVIAFDAEAIELNVRKAYALTENDVTVEKNGVSYVVKNASYAAGAITVPLAALNIAEGDIIKVTVSHDAYLEDNTQVDEPVIAEFVAGDSNGRAIIVEDDVAKAYFGINADAAVDATVYVAAYKDDTLEVLASSVITITDGAASYESASLILPSSYDSIKCFVWIDDIVPYIESIIK